MTVDTTTAARTARLQLVEHAEGVMRPSGDYGADRPDRVHEYVTGNRASRVNAGRVV